MFLLYSCCLSFVLVAGATQPLVSSDPCQLLCTEFSAEFQGQGENLCDSIESSQCVASACTHLYWSQTEEGGIGLVYSLTGSDLIGNEGSSPVSCEQAAQMTAPPSLFTPQETSMNFFATALEVFVRLPVIRPHLMPGINETHSFRTILRDHLDFTVSLNGTGFMPPSIRPIIDYSNQRNGVTMNYYGDTLPLVAMRRLLREFGQSTGVGGSLESQFMISIDENLGCTGCNTSRVIQPQVETISLSAVSGVMQTVQLQETITQLPSGTCSMRCGGCGSSQSRLVSRRLMNPPEMLVVDYQRYIESADEYMITNIQIQPTLDLSSLVQTDHSVHYRLIAMIHREYAGGDYFATFIDPSTNQWFQYRNGLILPFDLVDNSLSSTASAFFYHRSN